VYESGVMPVALAVFPAVELDPVVDLPAVVFEAAVEDDELDLLLLHPAATMASTPMTATVPL